LSEIENLLTLARQPSRTAAQVRELQRAIDRWLLADPEACIAWLENRKATGLIRKELLPSVCAFHFDGQMVKAMRLAAQISDPLLHYAFISAAFEAAAEMHPQEALMRWLPCRSQSVLNSHRNSFLTGQKRSPVKRGRPYPQRPIPSM
jgi:hypothetical protein